MADYYNMTVRCLSLSTKVNCKHAKLGVVSQEVCNHILTDGNGQLLPFGQLFWQQIDIPSFVQGATDHLNDYAIKKAYFTTAANPKEYRKFAPLIAADDEEGFNAAESQAIGSA